MVVPRVSSVSANGLIVQSGNVGIGTAVISGGLKMDVAGPIGATQYCDENGANCFTAPEASGGGGVATGQGSRALGATGAQVITHNLGRVPEYIQIEAIAKWNRKSFGTATGTGDETCTWSNYWPSNDYRGQNTTHIIYLVSEITVKASATLSATSA